VKTQVISSGFLWGFGDVTAQYITHSTAKRRLLRLTETNKDADADAEIKVKWKQDAEFKVNWKRVAITSMFGFGFVGPVGHFWFVSF
jgi:protein Mpv17